MIKYLLKPRYIEPLRGNYKEKIKALFFTYLIIFLSFIAIAILLDFIDSFVVETLQQPSVKESIQKNPNLYFKLYGNTLGFLLTVLFFPLIEETFFRLPLNLKPLSLSIVIGLIFYRIFKLNFIEFDFYRLNDYIIFILSVLVSLFTYKVLKKKIPLNLLTKIKNNYFFVIFYGIAVIFASLHISIFNPTFKLFYIYPFFVLPQFITALFTGAVRMKYGFIWGVLLHIMINLPASIRYLISH